jgi:dethiobiotin synthetase
VTVLFITGTHTGIGKTLVTAALAAQLAKAGRQVAAIKPVASGFDEQDLAATDTGILLAALGRDATPEAIEAVSPFRFAAPISPDLAAAREGRRIEPDRLVAYCRRAAASNDVLLIEGVGGAMTPLAPGFTVLDWIAAVGCPAVLVAGSYLGTLSHTLTACAAMRARRVALAAVIVSESADGPVPLAETCATLAGFLDPVRVLALPRLAPGPLPWLRAPDLAAPLSAAIGA